MDRRRFLAAGGMATALLGGFPARLQAADPAVTGSWTAPFNLGLVSIHAILLHTGNVLLFSWPNDTVGSDAVLWTRRLAAPPISRSPISGTFSAPVPLCCPTGGCSSRAAISGRGP